MTPNLKDELEHRGLVTHKSTAELSLITETKRHLYVGFEPTSDSLHIGHLVPFILARHFARFGHQVTLLVGGATAFIGDPSGKSQERVLLDETEIKKNTERITTQIKSLMDEREFNVVNNIDWIKNISLIEFLRETGKHFTVGNLLQKESIRSRLESEQGISYTEFSYSLIQAFDFYHLNQKYGIDLQIGGGDQWGNVSAGIDFIRRKAGQEVFGLTAPLIINPTTGKKFGKSEGEAIWLDEHKTSPYQFYQFWLNTDDQSAIDYLKYFTFVPLEQIASLAQISQKDPSLRQAQKTLAQEMTEMIHGQNRALSAIRVSEILFASDKLSALGQDELQMIQDELPTVTKSRKELESSILLTDVVVELDLVESKREARQLVKDGALNINRVTITDDNYRIGIGDIINDTVILISRGKKNFAAIRVK